ncbi:MAG TPA: ATP-dependent helicase, partial [Anaerolineae bacterium]|nr:ATP-dependent helicase [Anaerolineae bacterium]
IAAGKIDVRAGQQVLIVTYLNASAENFKTRLRDKLVAQGLQPVGYDARTLHSMALEIVKLTHGDMLSMPAVLDDGQASNFLSRAIDLWKEVNPEVWQGFLPDKSPQMGVRWRGIVERTTRTFIRRAKNARYKPDAILSKIGGSDSAEQFAYTRMFAEIYQSYQNILRRQAALDYDDQIWEAVDALEQHPSLADHLRQRWPYILEDEAQDSVPLQEALLKLLGGDTPNLVRVGDPNQAITTTFTAADPRFFNNFWRDPAVTARPLPNSGRNAPIIFELANQLVAWVCDEHPVPEVRASAFLRQRIEPTPAGDAQPNPPDSTANVVIKQYAHRQDAEIPATVKLANHYIKKFPQRTCAILVPTNYLGHNVIEILDEMGIQQYDSLLRGGLRERQIASALHALLALLAEPLRKKHLEDAFFALREIEHPAATLELDDLDRFRALLRSVHRVEMLLYPVEDNDVIRALPQGVATGEDIDQLMIFTAFLRRIFAIRSLPIDALAMSLGDELFVTGSDFREGDLAIAYQLAQVLRSWQDLEPEKRLPDLVEELGQVATGRRRLNLGVGNDEGFEPRAGRITLTTQHSAKGLEFDAVFMIGVDNYWIPSNLEAYFQGVFDFMGGDPTAQASAELLYLMENDAGIYPERTPTEAAHIEIISERLRLLYVGITRAKRFLQISYAKFNRGFNGQDRRVDSAEIIHVLHQFVQQYKRQHQV